MDVRPPLIADAEPPVLVDPGQRPLHRPAGLAQPAPGRRSPSRAGPARRPAPAAPGGAARSRRPGPPARRRASSSGGPPCPPPAGCSLNSGANSVMSLTLAAVTERGQRDAVGVGDHVVLAAGLGPVHRAGAGRLAAVGRPHEAAVDQRPRPVDLVGAPEPVEQDLVDLVPGAVGLPVAQPPPAGHAAAAAHLAGQVLPGDAGLEHEEDAGQGLAVVDGGAGRPWGWGSTWAAAAR